MQKKITICFAITAQKPPKKSRNLYGLHGVGCDMLAAVKHNAVVCFEVTAKSLWCS